MQAPENDRTFSETNLLTRVASAVAMLLFIFVIPWAQAQTITVLHAFTGAIDGAQPQTGVTIDRGGNLYGTTVYGGVQTFSECQPGKPCGGGTCQQIEGCGGVYKLTHTGSGWTFAPLYQSRLRRPGSIRSTRRWPIWR